MPKTETTILIEDLLFKRLGRKEFGCKEVTIGWYGREVVDFITYSIDKDREIRCFEIKTSKSDFKSKNKLTFIGHRNYFVMPVKLYEELKLEILKEYQQIGVYALDGNELVLAKNATRIELKADKEVILSSIARSMQREWFRSINKSERLETTLYDVNQNLDDCKAVISSHEQTIRGLQNIVSEKCGGTEVSKNEPN